MADQDVLKNQLKKFGPWLQERGAELLAPTNEWELIRFRANGVVSVIYRNKRGGMTFTGEARRAFMAWREPQASETWRNGSKAERNGYAQKSVVKRTLLDRDGPDCFYCGKPMPDDDMTLEHLFSITSGGADHIDNSALAHIACNRAAGSMSVVEKVKLRERMRDESR